MLNKINRGVFWCDFVFVLAILQYTSLIVKVTPKNNEAWLKPTVPRVEQCDIEQQHVGSQVNLQSVKNFYFFNRVRLGSASFLQVKVKFILNINLTELLIFFADMLWKFSSYS